VADAVRGMLDGHVVMDRRIAEAGRYPAVDILKTLSRAAAAILTPEQAADVQKARAHLALYADMADMVRLSAYKRGSDPAVDEAVRVAPRIEAAFMQPQHDSSDIETSFAMLRAALGDG